MFKRMQIRKTGLSLPDLLAFALLVAVFVSFFAVGRYWSGPLSPPQPVDLSLRSLPYAMFLSISRIVITYVVCLVTSLAVGYWAAHSRLAENIIVPLIDIGQSIPVLGFLPGVVVFFLSLFPESRVGLEMAAIITLYVGMAWNLMLSFYGSIKTIPREYVDIIRAYGYGRLGILLRLELPYAMNGIVWNSMLSVAGGWFFITVCESYTLNGRSFNLVGLGSYMAIANEQGNLWAQVAGIAAMLFVLVCADSFIWKPLLRWAERFQRMEPLNDEEDDEPVLNFFAKSKRITNLLRKVRRRYAVRFYVTQRRGRRRRQKDFDWRWAGYLLLLLLVVFSFWGLAAGFRMVGQIPASEWLLLMRAAFYTFLRVNAVLVLSCVLMVPLGLWLGTQPQLVKRLQPVIQVIAAFPAPMIFPLLMTSVFAPLSIGISVASVFLMMFGAQWYLLFNVMSGVAGVPPHLVETARTTGMGTFGIIRRVYMPAVFPQLLTGLVTAAGGAWNVSIVAELVVAGKKEYLADGLGSYITKSAMTSQYPQLVAAVAVMVILIVLVNRLFWARLYNLAETKYRLDG